MRLQARGILTRIRVYCVRIYAANKGFNLKKVGNHLIETNPRYGYYAVKDTMLGEHRTEMHRRYL